MEAMALVPHNKIVEVWEWVREQIPWANEEDNEVHESTCIGLMSFLDSKRPIFELKMSLTSCINLLEQC